MTNHAPVDPSPERRGRLAQVGRALLPLLRRLRRRPSRGVERLLLAVSLVVFVGAAIAGAVNFPEVAEVRWWLLLLAGGLGMPLNILLNAAEFQVIGRFVDQRVPLARAAKVTVVGSAANMLPLPGSTLVRIQALVADEATYRGAISASIAVGVMSVGANLGLAGLAQTGRVAPVIVVALLAGSALVSLGGVALIRTAFSTSTTVRWGAVAFGVEVLYASTSAVRLWLILLGLGLDIGLPAAFALTATGSIANAVGFFPGGLGIREVLIGLVSPLVGVPVAAGITGAVVTRLFWFGVLAVAALLLLVREGRDAFRGTADAQDPDGEEPGEHAPPVTPPPVNEP